MQSQPCYTSPLGGLPTASLGPCSPDMTSWDTTALAFGPQLRWRPLQGRNPGALSVSKAVEMAVAVELARLWASSHAGNLHLHRRPSCILPNVTHSECTLLFLCQKKSPLLEELQPLQHRCRLTRLKARLQPGLITTNEVRPKRSC